MNNETIKKALVKELVDAFEKRLTTTIVSRGVVEGQVERIIEIYEPHFKQTNDAVEFLRWYQENPKIEYYGEGSYRYNGSVVNLNRLYELFLNKDNNGHTTKQG